MCSYWHSICPFCSQGRLFVFKNITDDKLYLHCEECERGWDEPEGAIEGNVGFLTITQEFDAVEASEHDIETYGWAKYALHKESI